LFTLSTIQIIFSYFATTINKTGINNAIHISTSILSSTKPIYGNISSKTWHINYIAKNYGYILISSISSLNYVFGNTVKNVGKYKPIKSILKNK